MPEQQKVEFPDFNTASIHGPVLQFVDLIRPHTEAGAAALAAEYITGLASIIGNKVYVKQGPQEHPPRINVFIIGESSKGRKGTAHGVVEYFMRQAAPDFFPLHKIETLVSGAAFIKAATNLAHKTAANGSDPDMRAWIVEEEAVNLLASGHGVNDISSVVRKMFDSGKLSKFHAKGQIVVEGVHFNVTGHITEEEFSERLPRASVFNGFLNRFMLIGTKNGGFKRQRETIIPEQKIDKIVQPLQDIIAWVQARTYNTGTFELKWATGVDDEYDDFRLDLEKRMDEATDRRFKAAAARGATHVMRLALMFAIIDREREIKSIHLHSAIGMWQHAEDTLRYLYQEADEHADEKLLLEMLRIAGPHGMNTKRRVALLGGRMDRLTRAEAALEAQGLVARGKMQPTGGGRPAMMMWAVEHAPPTLDDSPVDVLALAEEEADAPEETD